ncbi:MAG: hypothetical protein QW743_07965 [Candidatus Methanomethylicia archaeon]
MLKRCPGVKSLIDPKIIVRSCPFCGEEIEFFEYENQLKCPNCGKIVHREPTETCLSWCGYAEKCIYDLEVRGYVDKERAEELRKLIKKK